MSAHGAPTVITVGETETLRTASRQVCINVRNRRFTVASVQCCGGRSPSSRELHLEVLINQAASVLLAVAWHRDRFVFLLLGALRWAGGF